MKRHYDGKCAFRALNVYTERFKCENQNLKVRR